MTVMEGKIAVIDVNNKTTTQKYSGAVTGTSKLWLDNNFTTGIVMEIKGLFSARMFVERLLRIARWTYESIRGTVISYKHSA